MTDELTFADIEQIILDNKLETDMNTISKVRGFDNPMLRLLKYRLLEFVESSKHDVGIDIKGFNLLFKKEGYDIVAHTFLVDAFNAFTDYLHIADELIKRHPVYYDSGKNWWIWDWNKSCYILTDETDILNAVDKMTQHPNVNAKVKNEILESLRRVGRQNRPKDFRRSWIQFHKKIIDFESGEEFDASPEYFSCNPVPYELGDDEETPTINRLFEEWVGKNNVKTLYQIIAYCLIQDYPIHMIFCLFGEGLNGKSCFLRILKKFLGQENCCSTELELLLDSRFEMTRLHKKLACLMTETNFEEIGKTSIIKKLTGQDLIGFEYKNKALFDDVNYAKILISTNNLPPTTDKTIGFYRRWLIIDFPNRFKEGHDVVVDVPEAEYKNLAKKSIKMLKDLIELGHFHNSGEIEDRMKRYEDRSNPFDKFFKENVIEEYDGYIGKTEFKRRLEEWCKENKFRIMSEGTISKKMKDLNLFDGLRDYYDAGERKQFRVWHGIKWKSENIVAVVTKSENIVTLVTDVTGIPTPSRVCEEGVGSASQPSQPSQEIKVSWEKIDG